MLPMMEEEKWVIDYENENKYSRSYHTALHNLNQALQECYSQRDAPMTDSVVATSGMHAITLTLDSAVENLGECNIVYGNELYCDTLSVISDRTDSKSFPIDVLDTCGIMELFGQLAGKNNILFIESCSNPSGHIFDFRIIPELRRLSKELIVIVDNTWLTHVVFNPFVFDVDIVVVSLTKYYSGGKVIAGASLFQKKHAALHANTCSKLRWVHISGYDCTIITENMKTMHSRLQSSSSLCLQLVQRMQQMQLQQQQDTQDVQNTQRPMGLQFIKLIHPSLPGSLI